MNNHKFKSLLILYALYVWFSKVSSSIIPAYLLGKGTSINQMFLASIFQFIPMILVLIFIRIKSAKLSWRLAIISVLLAAISVVNVKFSYQVYLTYVFSGIALALFFVYYNVGHFLYTPKGKTGISGGIMYAINPAISIFAPIIAGGLAVSQINYLWVLCVLSFIVVFGYTATPEDFSISYSLKKSYKILAPVRVPIFIEGIWESVLFAFIPLSTLHFITSPAGYGQYLGYLSLIGTIAGLLLGHYSDKLGKRSFLLWPICIILSFSTIGLFYGLKTLAIWVLFTSIIQFVLPLFWNITTALLIDQNLDLKVAFPGREVILALGRMIGLIFTYVCIINSQQGLLLVILSIVIMILPIYLYYHANISKKYSYL
jgi:hypothetical protein